VVTRREVRRTSRALLVDGRDRLLLIRVRDSVSAGPAFWVTVGGGVEPGEDDEQALLREIHEETGLELSAGDLGPVVWERRVRHGYADHVTDQVEVFRFVRVAGEPMVRDEGGNELGHRWWGAEELAANPEDTWPHHLAELLPRVLAAPWTAPPLRLPDTVEDAPQP